MIPSHDVHERLEREKRQRELSDAMVSCPEDTIIVVNGHLDRILWYTIYGDVVLERGGHLGNFRGLRPATEKDALRCKEGIIAEMLLCQEVLGER